MTALILGLESSCDETAAAVTRGPYEVCSSVVATQHELHAEYAGVVPEIASRAHVERLVPVVERALADAGITLHDLDAIAVGHRPGLIGSLLVGVSAAKALSWALDRPLIGVDHVLAHLHAGQLDIGPAPLPALGLVVSGGHTSLYRIPDLLRPERLGATIDDAAGEAFDKAATVLELGYPGGPLIDRLAPEGNDRACDLPVSRLGRDSLDFSFSGLKTALLYAVCGKPVGRGADAHFERDASALTPQEKADFAASFQRAAVRALMIKLERALERCPDTVTLLVGGGVSANSRLRRELETLAQERGLELRLPVMAYCVDNAAMIAGYGALRFDAGERDDLTLAAASSSAV